MITIQKYNPEFQEQVKTFIIKAHEEFNFPYNYNLDYDLEDPKKIYIDTDGSFLLLLDENELIGTIALKILDKFNNAELKRFYIKKEYRGQKLGLMLYNEMLKEAKDKNIRELFLDTNTIQKQAIRFYEKNGFKLTKKIGNKLFMKKDLN